MNVRHTSQVLKMKSLLYVIGIGLSSVFLLFCFVTLAKADEPVVDLSQNEQDMVIRGSTDHGWLGEVTGSADFNGDGYEDLLVGETGNNYNGTWSGAAYMILGSETLPSSMDLTVTRPNLTIYGAGDYDILGHSVAGGDLNGDGYHDMIVGADNYNGGRGAVYVILGHNGGLFSTPITMDLAITSPALSIVGEFSDGRLGRSVASADINNDSFDDIVIGSFYASPGGRTEVGAVYVILGNSSITSTTPSTIYLESQSPALSIYGGDANDRLGRSVTVGDVDGDGIVDIVAGAYWADVTANNEGETYVFYGSESYTSTSPTTIDLDAGANPDVTIRGIDPGDESGFYVGSGDLNNDSFDDILISAYRSTGWNNGEDGDTGEAYVIYGANNLNSTLSLATSADVVVYGTDTGDVGFGDRLGRSVAAGDMNGDGYDDILLGSSWANPDGRINAGQAYVIYGGESISSTILLSDTTSSNIRVLGDDGIACGSQYVGDCGDEAGRAVSAGDVNNDGADDMIIGAVAANNGALDDSGAVYLVYGEKAATLSLAPAEGTITAGESITYTLTASNTFGTWDISELGNYTIDSAANGSWADNVYTGEISGTWTVSATFQSLATTAVLTVEHASATSFDVTPNPETITAGETVTYTATALDAYGNGWNVTDTTAFSIADGAGGTWVDNVFTSENAATWTVTGTYQSLEDTASLTVEPLQIAFSSATYEVAEDIGLAVITVTVSPPPLTQVTVDYNTTNGSAIAGSDYQASGGMLTFNPSTTELTFTVPITDDLVNENSEDLNLSLTNPSSTASISNDTAVLTITDNDVAGVTLSAGSVAVTEGGITDTYTIQLDTIPTAMVTVNFNTGSQIESITNLTFAADITALDPQTVTVTANDDTVVEGDHSGLISHSATGGGYNGVTIADVSAAITDNELRYTLAADNITVTEGDSSTSDISFTVTRTGDITRAGSVDFALSGTATDGIDYDNVLPASGTVSFSPGQISGTIDVEVQGDYEDENNETIIVTLSNPEGTNNSGTGSISGSPATTTITDDDTAGVTLAQSGSGTNVSESGSSDTYTVVLDSRPGDTVTVTLTFDSGQIRVNSSTLSVDLTFNPDEWNIAQAVTITAVDDAVIEGAHTSPVSHSASSSDGDYNGTGLFNVDGSTGNTITVNISDNDIAEVQITETGGSTNVTEGGTSDTYQVVLSTQPTAGVTVTISRDAQVDASEVISVVFTTGDWDTTQFVTVTAFDDGVYEGNHTGHVSHTATSSDGNYDGLSVAGVTANITDNDSLPTLVVSDLTVSEVVGTANMTVTLSGVSSLPVSVNYTVSDGTATSADYSATNGTLNWSPYQTGSRTVSINITDDDSDEPEETVNLTLSIPANASVDDDTGVLTIIDNDIPATPTLITPTNNITVTTKKPTFEWADGGSAPTGVVSYTLVITPSGQPPIKVTSVQPTYTPASNLDAGDYIWTVRAHDAEGNVGSYASPVANFILDPAGATVYLPVIIRN